MTGEVKKDYDGSMDSKYYFTAGKVGATTSAQVANQIGELNSRLNQGLKAVELGTMNQRLLDQVPTEHFTEIRRMNQLTGSEASIHAPIQDLDLAGFTQQGWDSNQRERSVRQLGSVIEKAHLLDPKGNTPITIHAGGMPSQKWEKKGLKEIDRKTGEVKDVKDRRSEMGIINQQTGETQLMKYKERQRFGKDDIEPWTPERQMENLNATSWDREQFQLLQWKKMMDEKEQMTDQRLGMLHYDDLKAEKEKGILTREGEHALASAEREINEKNKFNKELYQNMRSSVEDMNERLEKYKPEKGNEAEKYKYYKEVEYPEYKKEFDIGDKKVEEKSEEIEKIQRDLMEAKKRNDKKKMVELFEKRDEKSREIGKLYQEQTNILREAATEMPTPQTWQPIDDFAQEQVSTSVAEAAVNSFKEYGENSPLILLENVYPEFALSRADALKDTIEDSQKKFVKKLTDKKLMKDRVMNKKEAKKMADKLIGVTWDVGHIYMLKKSGYSDADIEEEAKKIAPHVKHLHLTDNFGFEDSHLPPGMGDVNIKDQLRAIEKGQSEKLGSEAKGKEEFGKFKGIVEAGEFVANYKEVPHLQALSNLESPLYTEETGPTWNQIWDNYGNYSGGYGEVMPQKYFDLYGAPGFSQLPTGLGGSGGQGPDRGRLAASAGEEEE